MSDYPLPAGFESWGKCEISGCATQIWGSTARAPHRCYEHGGHPSAQMTTTEYGHTTYEYIEAAAAPFLPGAVRSPLES